HGWRSTTREAVDWVMLFVLDNYDSFTYNLVQYFGELGAEPVVYRNDSLAVEDVLALKPTAAVLSPGPGTPAQAGILVPLVRALAGRAPVLGVCLGHQAIGEAFGGRVVGADRLMHGKTCPVLHEQDELVEGTRRGSTQAASLASPSCLWRVNPSSFGSSGASRRPRCVTAWW